MTGDNRSGQDSGCPPKSGETERTPADSGEVIRAGVPGGAGRPGAGTERPSVDPSDIIRAGVMPPVSQATAGNDIVLNGQRYSIISSIAASGEAESYLMQKDNRKLVLKLYYPRFAPGDEVVKTLKGLQHPHIIGLMDCGYYQNRFFEVREYAEGGSLEGQLPVKDLNLLKQLIAQILDGLDFCHRNRIIHRDIKPQNLFFRAADRSTLAIGDFGISTALTEGFSKKLTGLARTAIYAAPEVFQSIGGKTVVDAGVDYYALGITLIHLWTGTEPFEGLGEFGMMRMKIEGRVDVPEDLPEELRQLVKGLITVEPPKRWGYEQVSKWLSGEQVAVHHGEYRPGYGEFVFGVVKGESIVVSDAAELADWMDEYPEIGKTHLYRKSVSRWVERVNPGLFSELESIVDDEYPKDQAAGLTKAVYVLDPERAFRGVDGGSYASEEELADCLEKNFHHYQTDLKKPGAPLYLFLDARGYRDEADRFRNLFKSVSPRGALNSLILTFQGRDTFVIGQYRVSKPQELLTLDRRTRTELAKYLRELDSKLSIWIQSFPELKDSIDRWRSLDRFDDATFRYALQGGLEFQGEIATDISQVKKLLKKYPRTFDREEANYWLKNYMNTSLSDI